MSRFIPEHPPKGSAEAYAWAEKMRAARQKKARLKNQIRQAGLKTEQEFFGPGGPLAPKAIRKRKLNPVHDSRPQPKKQFHIHDLATNKYVASFPSQVKAVQAFLQALKAGAPSKRYQVVDAYGTECYKNPGAKWHQGEEDVAYRYKRESKDPLEKAFFAGVEAAHKTSGSAARKMGMNPKKVKKNPIAIYNPSKVAGTIYNNAIEIKAQKTGGPLKGHYKHVFGSNVRILGLTDGTVLLQHKDGKPLWITRKDYERSGRHHH